MFITYWSGKSILQINGWYPSFIYSLWYIRVKVSDGVQTHRKAAPVCTAMHPLHVQHGSEQADVVVDATVRLHAFKQLEKVETNNLLVTM